MAAIDKSTDVLEEFETLLELSAALRQQQLPKSEKILAEVADELADEYRLTMRSKIIRWASASVVQYLFDKRPVQFFFQAKMLYRDGYYEATIMLCRSIGEMICYDRLDGISHPFGSVEQMEKRSFRELLRWLNANDSLITSTVFQHLNDAYDIGNNYVHPKSGQTPSSDSIKMVHLVGQALFEVYGLKSFDDLVGRKIRSAYIDFPDINSGQNFVMNVFASPTAAAEHLERHNKPDQKDLEEEPS